MDIEIDPIVDSMTKLYQSPSFRWEKDKVTESLHPEATIVCSIKEKISRFENHRSVLISLI